MCVFIADQYFFKYKLLVKNKRRLVKIKFLYFNAYLNTFCNMRYICIISCLRENHHDSYFELCNIFLIN